MRRKAPTKVVSKRFLFNFSIAILISCLGGLSCRLRQDAGTHDELRWLTSVVPDDFLDPVTVNRAVDIGIPALPALIELMKDAGGDIQHQPGETGEDSERYLVQFCMKVIIQQDVMSGHPEYMGALNLSIDNSLQFLSWWQEARDNILGGRRYEPPEFMFPFRSMEELSEADGSPESLEILRRHEQQRVVFKRLGFDSIREMLDHGISIQDIEAMAAKTEHKREQQDVDSIELRNDAP